MRCRWAAHRLAVALARDRWCGGDGERWRGVVGPSVDEAEDSDDELEMTCREGTTTEGIMRALFLTFRVKSDGGCKGEADDEGEDAGEES